MKKSLFISLLILGLFCNINYTYAEDTQSESSTEKVQLNLVSEIGSVQIVKKGEKYAIIDKDTKAFIVKPIIDDIKLFDESKPNIFKIYIDGSVGFVDIDTDTKIITKFDDINLFGDYLKFNKGDKVGVLNTKAEVILPAEFDKITIDKYNENDVFCAKIGDEKKLYTLEGKEISETNLYTVNSEDGNEIQESNYTVNIKDSEYSELIRDLKPEIMDYIVAQKTEELKEKLSKNVKVASVEKNVQETVEEEVVDDTPPETSEVTYGNLNFYLISKNNKIGLNNVEGFTIAPMIFDKIDIDTPCKHFKDPIVIGKNENKIAIYNLKGKELANYNNEEAHVYWYGKRYTYTKISDKIWEVKVKNKTMGRLVQEDSKYKFTKTGFSFLSMHKVNEIFINLLSI